MSKVEKRFQDPRVFLVELSNLESREQWLRPTSALHESKWQEDGIFV